MDHKNFKKCHSRNLDQTDLILDFLSTLDKSKNAFTWQDEISQINRDWCQMMSSGDEEECLKEEDRPDSKQEPLTPSKRVTWSEKLTNVKAISPNNPNNFINPRSSDILKSYRNLDHYDNPKLRSPSHQQKYLNNQHSFHQKSPRKNSSKAVRLISFHPSNVWKSKLKCN